MTRGKNLLGIDSLFEIFDAVGLPKNNQVSAKDLEFM